MRNNSLYLGALLLFCLNLAAEPLATPAAPKLAASGYLLYDFNSGQVLAEQLGDGRLPPASLTKMLSAYTVIHELEAGRVRDDELVSVSEKAWRMVGSRMFIEVGSKVPLAELLKGVIIQSGNDATVALAEHIAGSEEAFVSLMNGHAKRLGLKESQFTNSTGLPDPNHYSTPRDMARLAAAIIRQHPDYYPLYAEKRFKYNNIEQYNRNKLLWRDSSVDGLKTGHTKEAGYCLVASALRSGQRLISVVMGTKSEKARAVESQKLLNYGFRFFESHTLYTERQSLKQVRVWQGEQEQLALGTAQSINVAVARGHYKRLKATISVDQPLIAPIQKGAQLGHVTVRLDDQVIAEAPLIALQGVAEGPLFSRLLDKLKMLLQ